MNIKTVLKSSVAAAALFAIAAPVATTANAADDTFKTGNKNSLTMSGYVSRAIWYGDDGVNEHLFNTNGKTATTRVRWIAKGQINENVSMGSMIESNLPISNLTGAFNTAAGSEGDELYTQSTSWSVRQQYVWVKHKTLGRIALGHTDGAANSIMHITFAKTVATSDGRWHGDSIQFLQRGGDSSDSAKGSFTGTTPGSISTDLDFTSRSDVIKYNTPTFGGLGIGVSLQDDGTGEIGGRFSGKFGPISVKAGIGYTENSAGTARGAFDYTLGGALAIQHSSGINARISAVKRPLDGTNVRTQVQSQVGVGYNAKIFGVGGTGFSFTYNDARQQVQKGDRSNILGFVATQSFDSVGATVHLAYYNYSYHNDKVGDRTIDDIDVFGLQTTFNF